MIKTKPALRGAERRSNPENLFSAKILDCFALLAMTDKEVFSFLKLKSFFLKSLFLFCLLFLFPTALAAEPEAYLWPVPVSRIVTQGYTPRTHEAIDILGQLGDSIIASRDGTVIYALTGCNNVDGLLTGIRCARRTGCSKRSRENYPLDGFCNYGFGNGVVLRHSDGAYTAYAHFVQVEPSLRRGKRVEQGQHLGEMGSSGRSTAVHLHFSVTGPKSPGFTRNRLNPADVFGPFVYVTTTVAIDVTRRGARLEGLFSYLGEPPDQVGILLGETESALRLCDAYFDTEIPPRPYLLMYYEVDNIHGRPLEPGATYYWQCYAMAGEETVLGEIRSFTTLGDD